ncbi:Gfo/Idh/MocA family oxidoreductase [Streptomyces sp. NPDC091201]|uniref:Gfo/Idh/MocA family oxidoreductase n=1 Tax=Streptomyces sp. NPDC091201 TaxID=3155190 RepID=UPI00342E1ADF
MFGRDPEKTAQTAARFGFASSTDTDTAFEDPSYDLVDICLPPPLHTAYVLRALDAGSTHWSNCPWPTTSRTPSGSPTRPRAAAGRCSSTCAGGSSRPTGPCWTRSARAPTGGWNS